jgi:ABC-type multidrug transport system ATPase subunit
MLLEVINAHKAFGRNEALRGVTLHLESPAIVALTGRNGAGKSTLLQAIAGVLALDVGEIRLDGARLSPHGGRERRPLGYVPAATDVLPHLTVGEFLSLVSVLKSATDLRQEGLRQRLSVEALLHRRIGTLSLGQKRRCMLVAGLIGNPTIYLVDEPTNGLDPDGMVVLVDLIRELKAAGSLVLVATHDIDFADRLDATRLQMEAGELVAG